MNSGNPLAQSHVFAHLDETALQKISVCAQVRQFQTGDWIVHNGVVWANLFFIRKGQVTAIKESPEGRSLTLATFGEGEVFWGLAFFIENAPMPAALKASEECELLLWSRDDFMPFILQVGQLSWELTRLVIQRVQFVSEIVEKLAFQPLTSRVARLLLEQFPSEQDVVPRHLTLDEMASRVGTTREIVCRILYRFAEQGAIQINRTEFTFLDRGLLEEQTRRG
ncbi:MAG: Crp/Fnr family transcriptional regulator [Anaerolineae bacterium]|nr:Crp/Fnr family transcriptional regulator [Anaerolineae bacterium]